MSALTGITLPAPVVPYDTQDIYPSHKAKWGEGGHRTVDTLTERNNITALRREEGMLVYVKADQTIYILLSGFPTTIGSVLSNAHWDELSTGGTGGGLTRINIAGLAASATVLLASNVNTTMITKYSLVISSAGRVLGSDIRCVSSASTDVTEYGIIGDSIDYELTLTLNTNLELFITNNDLVPIDISLLEIDVV